MKKVSITILLILPFILIYFISVLGKVIQRFGHVAVETVAVFVPKDFNAPLDEKDGNVFTNKYELKMNETYNCDIDSAINDTFPIEIVVGPSNANNKAYKITNSDESVSKIEIIDDTPYLTLLSRGFSKYTVTTMEDLKVTTTFFVSVEEGDLKEMRFYNREDSSEVYTNGELNLSVGRSRQIGIEYWPLTTREDFKDVTWTFDTELDFAAPITFDEKTRKIEARYPGTVVATATSNKKNKEGINVSASLKINVTETSEEKAYFNFFEYRSALTIQEQVFDLKSEGGTAQDLKNQGKILFNDSSLTYDDVFITVTDGASSIDNSRLSDLVIAFNDHPDGHYVTIDLHLRLPDGTSIVTDSMTIYYKESK